MSEVIDTMGLRVRDDFDDKEPRIRDLELGKRLGFDRPRDVRKLITRLLDDGKLRDIRQCATVARREDGMPSKPATEYWLDEKQALKVIAKSETATADAILDEVIDVFVAYRRGRLMPRLLADDVCEWDEMFTPSLVKALCRLYGQPYRAQPRFCGAVYKKLYILVLDRDTYVAMKARSEDFGSAKLHQQMIEQARTRFRGELRQIEITALLADSVDDFWARLERLYLGHPLQLRLMGMMS